MTNKRLKILTNLIIAIDVIGLLAICAMIAASCTPTQSVPAQSTSENFCLNPYTKHRSRLGPATICWIEIENGGGDSTRMAVPVPCEFMDACPVGIGQ